MLGWKQGLPRLCRCDVISGKAQSANRDPLWYRQTERPVLRRSLNAAPITARIWDETVSHWIGVVPVLVADSLSAAGSGSGLTSTEQIWLH